MKTNGRTGGGADPLTIRDDTELTLISNKGKMVSPPDQRNPRDRPQLPGSEAHRPHAKAWSSKASPRSSATMMTNSSEA